MLSDVVDRTDWIVQCFTSPPTQYRLVDRTGTESLSSSRWWSVRPKCLVALKNQSNKRSAPVGEWATTAQSAVKADQVTWYVSLHLLSNTSPSVRIPASQPWNASPESITAAKKIIQIMHSSGAETQPCLVPLVTSKSGDISPFSTTAARNTFMKAADNS